tara:strand:- start:1991 stop:3121 length:1131 start_codon:yes stop_codon:yes gene_type:complete
MYNNKTILFLTGTRADFGKIKSLIKICELHNFKIKLFVTGMHLIKKYGYTVNEIKSSGFKNIYLYKNFTNEKTMDLTLSNTINGLSNYINKNKIDMIVIHGDRVESLAGAIVGSLNNILVSHIEGGEVSGTIDELIRHSISKLSHLHFVSNDSAKKRLIQMGEDKNNIHIIGSPDVDLMFSKSLPSLAEAKNYYDIQFKKYSIVLFHPVTTEHSSMKNYAKNLVQSLIDSELKYVVIYPNNDIGSKDILKAYNNLTNNSNFRIFPSLRFEYFLKILKNSSFIIGNSSAGIRESHYYNVKSINIGTRQNRRYKNPLIINCGYEISDICSAIKKVEKISLKNIDKYSFGSGESDKKFIKVLSNKKTWNTDKQKYFIDL